MNQIQDKPPQVATSMQETLQAARASSNEPTFEPIEPEGDTYTGSAPDPSGPDFEPIDGDASGPDVHVTGYPGNVTPFSDEEVFNGTLQSVLYGYQVAGFQWRSQAEVHLFSQAFTQPPMFPVGLPVFVKHLGVGDALARYGIGHGMAVEKVLGKASELPAWVILTLYTAVSFGASYFGMKVVQIEREREGTGDVGAGPSGSSGPDMGVQEEQRAA